MKTPITLLLAFSLLLALPFASSPALAVEIVASGNCGSDVTWALDDSGALIISGTGEMENYGRGSMYSDYVYPPWHSIKQAIKTVIIEPGVTTIGRAAFNYTPSLTNVSIPSTVKTIEKFAFMDCESLLTITIPEGTTGIMASAFSGCVSLKEVSIPSTVKSINNYAFGDCFALKTIRFYHPSNTGMQIEMRAFDRSFNVDTVVQVRNADKVPFAVRNIPWGMNKRSYTYQTIPRYETPPALPSDGIASGFCGVDATWILNSEGVLTFSGTGKIDEVTWEAEKEKIKTIIIEEGITEIAAHLGTPALTSVTIPGSVKTIGNSAFAGCKELTQLTLSDGVVSIGEQAFIKNNLPNLTIPASVTFIGKKAFAGEGNKLKTLQFEHTAEMPLTIESDAFSPLDFRDSAYLDVYVPDTDNINPVFTNSIGYYGHVTFKTIGEDSNTQSDASASDWDEDNAAPDSSASAEMAAEATYLSLYSPVIEKYRKAKMDQVRAPADLRHYGVSSFTASYAHVGYALMDLDNNGIPELIIGGLGLKIDDDVRLTGPVVYEVHTLVDNTPVMLTTDISNVYLINDNKLVAMIYSTVISNFKVFQVAGDHLEFVEAVSTTTENDYSGQTVYHTSAWRYNKITNIVEGDFDNADYTLPGDQMEPIVNDLKAQFWMPELTKIA